MGQNKCQIKLFKYIINKSQPLLDNDFALSQVLGGGPYRHRYMQTATQILTSNDTQQDSGANMEPNPAQAQMSIVLIVTLIAPSQAPTSAHIRLEVASRALPPMAYICHCPQATLL